MPEDNRNTSNNSMINRANIINRMMNAMFRRTQYSNPDNRNALEVIKKDIDSNIDNLIKSSVDTNGTSVTTLYNRVQLKQGVNKDELMDGISHIFDDKASLDGVLSVYMENKYIRNMDLEIKTILKYMPQLKYVLNIKKDSILSADSFSKDFINLQSNTSMDSTKVYTNVEQLKEEYELLDLVDEIYDDASELGEAFIYVLPYKKAMAHLLANRDSKGEYMPYKKVTESSVSATREDIINSIKGGDDTIKVKEESIDSSIDFKIKFNKDNVICSAILESSPTIKKKLKSNDLDLDSFDYESFSNAPDGLVDANSDMKSIAKDLDDVKGCIVRKLKRENVIPIYIQDMCLGYYYIETGDKDIFDYVESIHDPFSSIKRHANLYKKDSDTIKDEIIKKLATDISKQVDSNFVKNNQDLRKELFLMLKHNQRLMTETGEEMTITFIPPEEIHHIYFKKDPKTHRGISDLAGSFIPAKLYSAMYIGNTVGVLTRSYDKRAYFVKQHVDTNISQSLLNVINQIKKSNFGKRELDNIDSIFNISGRYNDYVIPVSQGGDRPIDFEVISGQDIDTKDELMERLQSMAIKPLDVPDELVENANSYELATRLVMVNARFLRHVIKRQSRLQVVLSRLFTSIYNCHFGDNEKLECILPPPSYLQLSNINELWTNASDFVDRIIELEVTEEDRNGSEDFEVIFKKNLMRYYLSHVNWDNIDAIKKKSILEANKSSKEDDGY